MSNERQETIEDIVADIRAQNQGLPEDGYALSPLAGDLLSIADRIEAAAKREREAGAEAAQVCGEIGEMIGREAARRSDERTAEKYSAVGNAAAMLEALEAVVKVGYPHNFQKEAPHIRGYCCEITTAIKKCFDALSVPPRNCDLISDTQEALEAIHEDRCYVNNPIDERRLTVEWLFAEAKGATDGSK